MKDIGVWKLLTSSLASMLVTGLLAWFSFGGGVSRAEGDELKKTDSDLLQRTAILEERLATQQATLNEVKSSVKEGNAATQGKLDAIILALPRDSGNPGGSRNTR